MSAKGSRGHRRRSGAVKVDYDLGRDGELSEDDGAAGEVEEKPGS
jgi:hypothetical protein